MLCAGGCTGDSWLRRLSTARRIVEEHGGVLSAMSEPGRGTCFSITLPLAVELAGQQSGGERASDISFEDPAVAAAAEAEIVDDEIVDDEEVSEHE